MTAYAIPCDLVVPIFNPGDRSKTPASQLTEQMMRDYSGGKPPIFRTLVHMDDPDHSAYRKVTSAQLLPTAIAPLEDLIREISRSYIGKMLSGGPTIDFASEIAMHYPLKVVCTLMGLSKPDHKTMLRLTQRFLSYAGPDLCRPGSKLLDPEHMIRTWQIVYDEFCDRSSAQDHTLSGRPIKAGDLLYVSYFSASRDDTAFEDPYVSASIWPVWKCVHVGKSCCRASTP